MFPNVSMSSFRMTAGLRRTSAVKMLARSILVPPSTFQKSGKRIIIALLRSTVPITSFLPFWDGSAFTPVRRDVVGVF
jgi:hypothetical protein